MFRVKQFITLLHENVSRETISPAKANRPENGRGRAVGERKRIHEMYLEMQVGIVYNKGAFRSR